jgi:acyl-CoA synthetase (NDP forming)
MLQVLRDCQKPILAVRIHGFDAYYGQLLCRGGIPFFESAERAVKTYALAWRYGNWVKKHSG